MPLVALAFLLWDTQTWTEPLFPEGGLTDGTIAIAVGLLLFVVPDGTGRPLLTWPEADRAPWGVIMMFGGGLALAAGMTSSGLAAWLGFSLSTLAQHNGFEQKPVRLTAINSAYQLVLFLGMAIPIGLLQ